MDWLILVNPPNQRQTLVLSCSVPKHGEEASLSQFLFIILFSLFSLLSNKNENHSSPYDTVKQYLPSP